MSIKINEHLIIINNFYYKYINTIFKLNLNLNRQFEILKFKNVKFNRICLFIYIYINDILKEEKNV